MQRNMTKISDFYRKDCLKIDPWKVDAYIELTYDEMNPTSIILDSSWGKTILDLKDIVKASETMTYLKLSPTPDPEYLEYDGEDGIPQCIHGDDLSKIISMQYLKDIDHSTDPADGDVYVYDSTSKKFKLYNISTIVGDLNTVINNLRQRIVALESTIDRPAGTPSDARLVWGNINLYSDNTNTNLKTSGFYSHNTETEKVNDEYFA